jgi:PAS domain S-box-containing protein
MSDGPDGERASIDYEMLVGAMGDGVYALDDEGNFLDFNESMAEMSGHEPAEIRRQGPEVWHTEAEIEDFEAKIREMLESGGPATLSSTLHTADGETVPIEVTMTPLPSDDGEYRGHIGVVRDVTERREREQELRRYETTVRAMPDEVYTLDEDGYFTSIVPPTGSELTTTGYRPEEMIGEHVSLVMDEADIQQGQEVIRELLQDPDKEKVSFEMEVIAKDGERIPNENHIALLPTADGEGFRGTVGVLRDISERKAREEELERQNERLEEFADVVSHDLRNPLNVAMGHLELLREDYDDERLDRVADAQARMGTIVEDVLALAQEGQTVREPEPVSLQHVSTAAWSSIANADATLTVEADLEILADGDRLQRLLENLFRNAVDHVGPEVAVRVGPIERDGTVVGFFVADDGPGIPEAEREHVMESGHTTAEDGTGLGLAIVQRIASAHDWTVSVTESEAGGARFEVTGVEAA